jgi:hypothetical protein
MLEKYPLIPTEDSTMNTLTRTLALLISLFALSALAAQSPILWTGGITLEERDAASAGGHYLSSIQVVVTDDSGREIVNTTTAGPWLILDLAPGTYQVQAARRNSDTQGGTISVSGDGGNYAFMFPDY